MTTYSTYQEAKIANPEEEILKARGDWDGCECYVGKFIANKPDESGGVPFIGKGAFKKCDPSKYCMTVEKFLADGHKFIGGDVFLNHDGDIVEVGKWYQSIRICPEEANLTVDGDENCYILRAVALEVPFLQTSEDFEHTKTLNFIRDRLIDVHGEPNNLDYMHKLNNAISFVERMEEPSKLCGSGTGKEEKPKRTKVSYEKVDCKQFEFWECAKEYQSKMHIYWKDSKGKFVIRDLNQLVEQYKTGVIYHRIETEITEREEFIEEANTLAKNNCL